MPFGGQPLAPAQIELIRAWIDQGAEIPESAATAYCRSGAGQEALGIHRAGAASRAGGQPQGLGAESH